MRHMRRYDEKYLEDQNLFKILIGTKKFEILNKPKTYILIPYKFSH
jgi:hypothetical protein